jgi:hypothetical protein
MPDEPGTKERCGRHILIGGGQGETKSGVGHGIIGIPTVAIIAGESRPITEVLTPAQAVAAGSTSPSEPGDTDPVTRAEALYLRSSLYDRAHDLVAQDERELGVGELTGRDVQIGSADPAGPDP